MSLNRGKSGIITVNKGHLDSFLALLGMPSLFPHKKCVH